MFHHVAKAVGHQLLFTDAVEAHALWTRVVAAVPGLVALCLMPDHVHLLHPRAVKRELGQALSAFARWRNARRGAVGPLFLRSPDPELIIGVVKVRRQVRYIHLNPCRAHLVRDPIAWPWSTHLDALGLAVPAARSRVSDPHGFHRYVSADSTVHPDGTDLPVPQAGLLTLEQVVDGVTAATRMSLQQVRQTRGPARRLLVACARGLTSASVTDVADLARVSRSAVLRTRPDVSMSIAALASDHRVSGWERRLFDPRWPSPPQGRASLSTRWASY